MNITLVKALLLVCISGFVALSCKRTEYICPAYQSVFYLDKDISKKQFTTKLGPDSFPLDLNLKLKDEHLLAKYIPYKKKEKMISTIPMVTIFNKRSKEDSLASLQFAAGDSVLKDMFRQGPALPKVEKEEDVEGDELPKAPKEEDEEEAPKPPVPVVNNPNPPKPQVPPNPAPAPADTSKGKK